MNQHDRSTRPRLPAALAGLAAAGGVVIALTTATAASADAATLSQHVDNTGLDGLYLHTDAPGLNTALGPIMADGTEFDITCFTTSDDVNGDPIWDYGTDTATGQTGYAADYYLDTPVTQGNEADQLTAMGLPRCGDPTVTSDPVTPQPSSISYGPQAVAYDRGAATAWAKANLYTPPSFEHDDCTWYVSQALWAGGLPQTDDWTGKSYDLGKNASKKHYPGPTIDAAQANSLVNYLVDNHIATRVPVSWADNTAGGAQPGDLIAYHWNDGETTDQVDHLAIVSDLNADGYPNVMQHTNANHRFWSWDPSNNGCIQQVDKIDGGNDPGVWLIHINDGPTY